MDALTNLLSRVSVGILGLPAPDASQLECMLQAAVRAPDHGVLRPWRFLILRGEELLRLGEIYAAAQLQTDPDTPEPVLTRLRNNPLRAPMVIVVVAEVQVDHKVPVMDQVLAAGAAAQNLLLAAHALGYGAMWRTGPMASHAHVKQALGFQDRDEIVGFLYVGTPVGSVKKVPQEEVQRYVRTLP